MQIVVDNLMTHYESSGNGKQIVILHGWGDSSKSWQAFAKDLSQQYEVVLIDLPGFGGTQSPAKVWGIRDYAQFIADFMHKAELKPYAIIGHSNGGAIAIQGISMDILSAKKVILLASAGIRSEERGRKTVLKLIAKSGKAVARPLPAATQQKLRRKLYAGIGSDMFVAEHMQATFQRVVGEDVQKYAEGITVPTVLIYGEQDTSTPIRYGQILHRAIAGSKFVKIADAGHFLQVDQPEALRKNVMDFLA